MSKSRPANAATIIFPSLANNILLGIDTVAITPSAQFLGFTKIPSGWHFLYTGANAVLSTRTGYWFHVPSVEPNAPWQRLFRWSADSETIEPIWDPAEHAAWQRRLGDASNRDVHGRLLPYHVDPSTLSQAAGHPTPEALPVTVDFAALTADITPALLNHVTATTQHPRDGLWLISTASSAPEDRDDIPGLVASDRTFAPARPGATAVLGEERELQFLGIDLRRTWRAGAVGRERTIDARDRSGALTRVLDAARAWSSVVSLPIRTVAPPSAASSTTPSAACAVDAKDIHERNDNDGDDDDDNDDDQSANASKADDDDIAWGRPLLGDLQLTFLMVLLLANWSCLQEWRRALELLLTSRALVPQRPRLLAAALSILRLQLARCDDVEGGLFDVQGEGAAFLQGLLRGLWETVRQLEEDNAAAADAGATRLAGPGWRALQQEMAALEAWLVDEWSWVLPRAELLRTGTVELEDGERVEVDMHNFDAEEERGEYAPVVVEL